MSVRIKGSRTWKLSALLLILFGQAVALGQSPQFTENPFSQAYRNEYGRLPAQPTLGDRVMANWLQSQTVEVAERWDRFSRDLTNWEVQRESYRHELLDMLGLSPMPPRTDLKAIVTGTNSHPEFTVENVHFQSRPGLYCTANVYIPKGLKERAPAILYLCGHGSVKKDGISYGNKVHYQHHGAWFARNGYVCMVMDSVQLGEIEGVHHGTYRLDKWWWNSIGFSAAGPEAWNCLRALDYLQSRDDVDGERLGVTGRSGGGAYSWWIAAIDDRIKAACPVAGITDLQNYVADGCVEGHCDCMFMVNTRQWDFGVVAALVAPRPLLICNTDKDNIFPLDGVMRIHQQVRRFYDHFDAGDQLGVAITEGGHTDTQELQMPVMRWFNRWLKKSDAPVANYAEKFFTPQQLRVFNEIPKDEITSHCFDSFTELAKADSQPTRQSAIDQLHELTFAAWPAADQASAAALPRLINSAEHEVWRLDVYEIDSQPQMPIRFYLLTPTTGPVQALRARCLSNGEFREMVSALSVDFDSALSTELKLLEGASSEAVDANSNAADRGTGNLPIDLKQATVWIAPRSVGLTALGGDRKYQTHVRRRFMLLGSTIASWQVWDVHQALRSAQKIERVAGARFQLEAGQQMIEVARMATLLWPEPASLTLAPSGMINEIHEAADFLNWSRVLTPAQLAELAESAPQ